MFPTASDWGSPNNRAAGSTPFTILPIGLRGLKLTVLVESDFDEEMVRLYINPQAESDTHAVASDGAFLIGMRGVAVRHRDESEARGITSVSSGSTTLW